MLSLAIAGQGSLQRRTIAKSPRPPVDLPGSAVHIRAMSFDIAHILDNWEYQPGKVVVRKFKSRDGVERIQLRVDLGLLQMNAAGRPDGKRPLGHESLFQHYQLQKEKYQAAHAESHAAFTLSAEDCAKLQQEAIQYHHRYICLFQLEDFAGVLQDTARNLQVLDFVSANAASPDLSWSLQQFRPQLIMMRTRAAGALALEANRPAEALGHIDGGLEDLRKFYRENERFDLMEQSAEIQSLEAWQQEIQSRRPLSEREQLEQDLREAVLREDYERAAAVRDKLRNLKTS